MRLIEQIIDLIYPDSGATRRRKLIVFVLLVLFLGVLAWVSH